MSYTLLLVEDDPAIANTLKYALEREGWAVTWFATVNDTLSALPMMATLSAIVMDVGLPDGSGFELCQKVRFGEYHKTVPILFLTARDEEIDKIIGLEMGADDYITKPFSPREVVARLKAIWRREQMHVQDGIIHQTSTDELTESPTPVNLCPSFDKQLSSGRWQYDDTSYQLLWNGTMLNLSKTELAILLTLLKQPSHILSREQILKQISDYPEHRLVRTIDSHIKSLRHKLVEIADHEVIVTHRGLGYAVNK